jgi:hypothetical protein
MQPKRVERWMSRHPSEFHSIVTRIGTARHARRPRTSAFRLAADGRELPIASGRCSRAAVHNGAPSSVVRHVWPVLRPGAARRGSTGCENGRSDRAVRTRFVEREPHPTPLGQGPPVPQNSQAKMQTSAAARRARVSRMLRSLRSVRSRFAGSAADISSAPVDGDACPALAGVHSGRVSHPVERRFITSPGRTFRPHVHGGEQPGARRRGADRPAKPPG